MILLQNKKIISAFTILCIFTQTITAGLAYATETSLPSSNRYINQVLLVVDWYIEKQTLALQDKQKIINKLTIIQGKVKEMKQQKQNINKFTGKTAGLINALITVIDTRMKELSISIGEWKLISTYPWCDTPDITLSNWQIWAACNIGSTIAWTGTNSYGTYHQWGRNDGWWTGGSADWQSHNNNSWGWSGTSEADGTWNEGVWNTVSTSDQKLMQWPCATNYHVPTVFEWVTAVNLITGKTSGWVAWDVTTLQTTLKLPMPGYRGFSDGSMDIQGTYGLYWSSSPSPTYGYGLLFVSTAIDPADDIDRAYGLSMRCLKN